VRADLIARLVAVAIGVWLMAAPAVLDYGGVAADNDRIIGPIAGSCAFVACWEVLMAVRWATVPFGVWLVLAPFVLGYDASAAWVSSIVSGSVIAGTAWVGRDVRDQFGGGWRSVRPRAWSTATR
jgi:hypothetical protein